MNTEFPWIKIIESDEEKEFDIPFFPQEYEEDKDDFEEWELLLD